MDVAQLLAMLDGVKGRNGSWIARCPAHADKSPSLTVKELDDGRILMHCFAGCGTDSVLGVLGLTLGDLFPEPLTTHAPSRKQYSSADVLRAMRLECSVVAIAAADLADGKPVDTGRVITACGRISEALEYAYGS
jgi:hypothetical protein